MKISPNGEAFLADLEGGFRLTPYLDQAGKWTVGCGHLMSETEPKHETITLERAKELFRLDLIPVQSIINHEVHRQLVSHEFDALCALVFNIGNTAFHYSTLLRRLNLGADEERIKNAWGMWTIVTIEGVKRVSNGLKTRRCKEWKLWSENEYANSF